MPDPTAVPADAEIRAVAERALAANYELDNELGRGGMGIVYRAKDRRLKRLVAIKLLPPELAFRSEIKTRFLREAETAAQLSHPNIVPIYSVDERDGLVYFVMALVEGPTLAKKMYEDGQMSVDETRRVLREVADALAYAHARGVIHRDIKPDNILLDKESGRAMVTDFGIARAIQEGSDSRLTATGVAIGTPAFMSPEQAAGDREIDGRTDLYALGVVAYQMLSGRLPFQAATTASMLMKQITERPTPVNQLRADCPADLAATVMSLLEKEPENRVASAAALSRALAGDVTVIPAVVDSPPPRTSSQDYAPRPFETAPSSPLPASHALALQPGHERGDRALDGARGSRLPRQVRDVRVRQRRDHHLLDLRPRGVLFRDAHLGHLHGVQVFEAVERRLRLARRVPSAARSAPRRSRGRDDRGGARALRQGAPLAPAAAAHVAAANAAAGEHGATARGGLRSESHRHGAVSRHRAARRAGSQRDSAHGELAAAQ